MKRTLLALVVLAVAAGFAPAKQDEVVRQAPADRCNSDAIKNIHQKLVGSDLEGLAKAVAPYGDSAGKIRLPGPMVDRGSAKGNLLCHHAVWHVIDRQHKDWASKSLGDQLMILTQLNLAFRPMDQAALDVWEQAEKVFGIARRLGIAQVDKVPSREFWSRKGLEVPTQGVKQSVVSARLAPPPGNDISKLQSELVGKPMELKEAILALIQVETPANGKELAAGEQVKELHRRIFKLRDQIGIFARDPKIGLQYAVVFKSWASGTGDNPGEAIRNFSSMDKVMGEIAVNNGGFVDGTSYPAAALDKIDYWTRDQLAVYYKQSRELATGLHGFIKTAHPKSETPVQDLIGALEMRAKSAKDKEEGERAAADQKRRDDAVGSVQGRVQGGLEQFYDNTRKGLGDLQDPQAVAAANGVGQEVAGFKEAQYRTLKGPDGTYIQAAKGDKIYQVKLEEGADQADPYGASVEALKQKIIAGEGWGAKMEALKVAAKNVTPEDIKEAAKHEHNAGNVTGAATAPWAKDDEYEKTMGEIGAEDAADVKARGAHQERYKKRLQAANGAFAKESEGIAKIKDPKLKKAALDEATKRRDGEIASAKAEYEEAIRVMGSRANKAKVTEGKKNAAIGQAREIYVDDFKDQFEPVRSEERGKAQAEVSGPVAKNAMGLQVDKIFAAVKAEEAELAKRYWADVQAVDGGKKGALPDPKEYWRKAYQAKLATWGEGQPQDPTPPVKPGDGGDPNYDPEALIQKEGGKPKPKRIDNWGRDWP